jgi:hypothetical protein
VAATRDVVEQETNEDPRNKIYRSRGWNRIYCDKKKWKIEVSQESDLEPPVQYPLDNRKDCTKKEEEQEAEVKLTVREETLRADDTPLQE